MRTVIPLFLALFLVACATPTTRTPEVTSVAAEIEAQKQREMALEAFIEKEKSLHSVGYPLLMHSAPLCQENIAPSLGMTVWNKHRFGAEWHETLLSRYQLTDLLQVAHIAPGSPAQKAGVKTGDLPVSINGWSVPVGTNAIDEFNTKLGDLTKKPGRIKFVMRRGKREIPLHIKPVNQCDYELVLLNDDAINAFADGERIVIFRGLMDFFKTDQEAGFVIAHELSHNLMAHIDAKRTNAMVGGLIGLLVDVAAAAGGVNTQGQFTDIGMRAGAGAYSVDFEKEADYVGLYIMARAGYKIDGAADFWRRMAIQDPRRIQLRGTHPTTPERFIGIEETVKEIKSKIAKGKPLNPEIKVKAKIADNQQP